MVSCRELLVLAECSRLPKHRKHKHAQADHWSPRQHINPHWPHAYGPRLAPKTRKRGRLDQTIGSQGSTSTHIGPMPMIRGLPKKQATEGRLDQTIGSQGSLSTHTGPMPIVPVLPRKQGKEQGWITPLVPKAAHQPTLAFY